MKRATDGFAVLIALAAFAVSYTTQVVLASEHGFPGWEAWLWPGIADAAALAMILRLHFDQVRPGWYTVEAWLVFAIASAVMVGANAVADRNDPLGGAMHAVVPVVAMLVWHVVIHGRPAESPARSDARTPARTDASMPAGTNAQSPARTPARSAGTSRARVEAMLQRAAAQGQELDSRTVAARLGVTHGHARRLLAEARKPHLAHLEVQS